MGKKSLLTYMEKDGPDYSEFVFYADKRCLSDEKYRKDLDLQNLHWHDYFELEIILEGHGKHHFNDSVYDLHPGNAYIVTPIDFHSVVFAEKTDSNKPGVPFFTCCNQGTNHNTHRVCKVHIVIIKFFSEKHI